MTEQATYRDTVFAGLPACELVLPQGDRLVVALHGAHILSWQSGGRERLYLSPRSSMDGQSAIRGGVPVCFPQFNQRGPMAERLPKHGFARHVPWSAAEPALGPDVASLTLRLCDSAQTRVWWPQAFELEFEITLTPGQLGMTLRVLNTDVQTLAFSGALHTYFAVSDVTTATLEGLGGQVEWDSLTNTHARAADTLRFGAEFDRVYQASVQPMTLDAQLRISQSTSWSNTVVWNPAQALSAKLADMPDEGWRHMLCVEAAQVYEPITLPAGGRWEGWQRLQVLNA